MSKINNITAYEPTTPTATTILIGSEDSDGATRNYLVSALATYMSTNLTNLTLTGFLTVAGISTFNGAFSVTSTPSFFNGINVLSGTALLPNITASGLPKLTGLSIFADNAAALGGGLVANDVYKTATGELRIVV